MENKYIVDNMIRLGYRVYVTSVEPYKHLFLEMVKLDGLPKLLFVKTKYDRS